jgi:hypothetical protein
MTTRDHASAVPFTTADYAARMSRVITDARDAGLDGVLVTPGRTSSGSPDTGRRPSPSDSRCCC